MVGLREQIGQIERSMRDFARECKAEDDIAEEWREW